MRRNLPLYLALLTLTQCSSCKDDPQPANPLSQLPPPTQTGANTFGCLVNGQTWTSKTSTRYGYYLVQYEPGITQPNGGNLNITMTSANGHQDILLSAGPIFQARTYPLRVPRIEAAASYSNEDLLYPCNEIFFPNASYLFGNLVISRLDEQAGVIAGTFEFAITKPGCDTVRVTNGRFDWKL